MSVSIDRPNVATFEPRVGVASAMAIGMTAFALAATAVWLVVDGWMADPSALARGTRGWGVRTLVALFWGGWSVQFAMAFVGHATQRNLRRWMALTLWMALWLGLQAQWTTIVEWGRVLRVRSQAAAIERFARRIDGRWEQSVRVGDAPWRRPFNAYPIARPRLAMLLSDAIIPGTRLAFGAIERSPGAVRFELSGADRGWWLEVRTDRHLPAPFEGGLDIGYRPVQVQRLSAQAFLVRYESDS